MNLRVPILLSLATLLMAQGGPTRCSVPITAGHFDAAKWAYDRAQVKAAIKRGATATRAAFVAVCPHIQAASSVVNDPFNQAIAARAISQSAIHKNLNNVNDALDLAATVCQIGLSTNPVSTAKSVVDAVDVAKRIDASTKGRAP